MTRTSEYRLAYYDPDGTRHTVYPDSPAVDNEQDQSSLLEHYVESGYAIGGHVEEYVGEPIGWVNAE